MDMFDEEWKGRVGLAMFAGVEWQGRVAGSKGSRIRVDRGSDDCGSVGVLIRYAHPEWLVPPRTNPPPPPEC